MERLRKKVLELQARGAPNQEIQAVRNEIKLRQKQSSAQTMFQSANHNAAAVATQAVNAANAVATSLHNVHQTNVTPREANVIANETVTNAKEVVSQSNELMKLARNAKAIADKLQSLTTSGGKRRKHRKHRTHRTRHTPRN
jgi:hypothetical protein